MRSSAQDYEEAFPQLAALARRAAFRIVRNAEDADDIAIETLARAYVRWARVEDYAARWVIRVATNLAIDRVRKAPAPLQDAPTPDALVEDQVAGRSEVAAALHRLPTRQREVIVLTVLCDKTMTEAAEILGLSTGTVKQHSHRAIASLRRETQRGARHERTEPTWTPTS